MTSNMTDWRPHWQRATGKRALSIFLISSVAQQRCRKGNDRSASWLCRWRGKLAIHRSPLSDIVPPPKTTLPTLPFPPLCVQLLGAVKGGRMRAGGLLPDGFQLDDSGKTYRPCSRPSERPPLPPPKWLKRLAIPAPAADGWTDGHGWAGRPVLNHRTDGPTDRPNGSVVGRRHYVLFGT